MARLTLAANIIAKDDKIDLVKTELENLIDITRAEEELDHQVYRCNQPLDQVTQKWLTSHRGK